MDIFVWLVTAFGITNILVFSKLFEPFRNWLEPRCKFLHDLFSCVMCCGAWVGFGMSALWSPTNQCQLAPIWISWFFDGMFASGGAWIINTVVSHFDND